MIQEKLRDKLTLNAKAYNKNYTDEYLNELSIFSLFRLVHPEDRKKYASEMRKLEGTNLVEYEKYLL